MILGAAPLTHPPDAFLAALLLELIVIIAAARLGGRLFRLLGQPQVIGETAAGLLLGPSFFGRYFPEAFAFLFPTQDAWPELAMALRALSEIGLILLMFLVGLEFEFGHLTHLGRTSAVVSIAGIVGPLVCGIALAAVLYGPLASAPTGTADAPGPPIDRPAFSLFLGVALSITAIPVLSRIMLDFGLTRTRLGVLVIAAAAGDDILSWTLLATVGPLARGGADFGVVARMLGLTVLFAAGTWFVVRPLLKRYVGRAMQSGDGELSVGTLAPVLLVVLAAGAATHAIGVHSVFGPFIVGATLWDEPRFREAVSRRMRDFVFVFFLPIFFASTGLRTNIGSLDSPRMWLYCGLVIAAAVAGKALCCGLAARFIGKLSWAESSCVAAMMNTRGLIELIVINVGRELGVIPDSVYCMLVLMALATTLMTAPALRRLLPHVAEIREGDAGRSSAVHAA
jgi:Kef-type K+ transport system membrane component KefB